MSLRARLLVQQSFTHVLLQIAVKNCFIRGSVVRYVQLPAENVDTQLLEDATRRGMSLPLFCVKSDNIDRFRGPKSDEERASRDLTFNNRFLRSALPIVS